jgi:hypothetical protein
VMRNVGGGDIVVADGGFQTTVLLFFSLSISLHFFFFFLFYGSVSLCLLSFLALVFSSILLHSVSVLLYLPDGCSKKWRPFHPSSL